MLSTVKGRFRKYDEMLVQERMNLRHINKMQIENGDIQATLGKDQAKLIIERKLGHKQDIPGVGQWNLLHMDNQ